MSISEPFEEELFARLISQLIGQFSEPLGALYDRAWQATKAFTEIDGAAVRQDGAILKILRFCAYPAVSQMRLGQLVGVRSTADFEDRGRRPTEAQADALAKLLRESIDRKRFAWLDRPDDFSTDNELRIAKTYARDWTISLTMNQNLQTAYRNQRKQIQEAAVAEALVRSGLVLVRMTRSVAALSDLEQGTFVTERKILVGRRQKSDLTVRTQDGGTLHCVEAKAVGIRIDSSKRLKELNDKRTDWASSTIPIQTCGVISGFFAEAELVATIRDRQIAVFWEHDLGQLESFIRDGTYFGSAWDPASLFPEVPSDITREALAAIDQAKPADEAPSEV